MGRARIALAVTILCLGIHAPALAAVRIVTFNLLNRPSERSARLENAVAVLRQLQGDILALQEVGGGWFAGRDSLSALGEVFAPSLGWNREHAWLETNLGIFKNGLAIFSRYPLREPFSGEMRASNLWDIKGFLAVTADTPRGELRVMNVHLRSTESSSVKREELAELSGLVRKVAGGKPLVLLGDFNWEWRSSEMEAFTRVLGATSLLDGIGMETATWNPSHREPCDRRVSGESHQQIDNVLFVQGEGASLALRGGDIRVPLVAPHPSDHCPLFADFELTKPAVPRGLP